MFKGEPALCSGSFAKDPARARFHAERSKRRERYREDTATEKSYLAVHRAVGMYLASLLEQRRLLFFFLLTQSARNLVAV